MITPQEAFLLFEGWRSANALLVCVGRAFDADFVLEGTIGSLSEGEMTILSPDKKGMVTLRLGADLEFEYRDPRDVPAFTAREDVLSVIAVISPLRVPVPPPIFPPKRERHTGEQRDLTVVGRRW
jgi:hypothetical protein